MSNFKHLKNSRHLTHWSLTHPYTANINENVNAEKALSTLYERFGIFDFDKQQYLNIFKSIVLSTMAHDKKFGFWKYDKVSLYKDEQPFFKYVLTGLDTTKLQEYSKSKYNFLQHIDALQIFISYQNSFEDCISICTPLSKSEENLYENDALPLYTVNNDNRLTVSIIIALENAMDYNPDEIADIIFHEFMHILKNTQNTHINNNVNDCNEIAVGILNIGLNINRLPDVKDILYVYNELKTNDWQFITKKSLYKFLAICVYYLDESERAAYLNNFRTSCKHALLNGYDFQNGEIFVGKSISDFKYNNNVCAYYTIYKLIMEILNNNNNLNLHFSIKHDNVLNYFFENYNEKNITTKYSVKTFNHNNLNSYARIWVLGCNNWLNKAQQIINTYRKIYNDKD